MKWLFLILVSAPVFAGSNTEKELRLYVSKFIEEAKAHSQVVYLNGPLAGFKIDSLVLEAGIAPDSHILGECQLRKGLPPKIIADFMEWERLPVEAKEMLTFHELGHCILGRQHEDAMIEVKGEQVPKSLMNSYNFSPKIYQSHRDYYLDELFSVSASRLVK